MKEAVHKERPEQTGEVVMEGVVAQILGVKLAATKNCVRITCKPDSLLSCLSTVGG